MHEAGALGHAPGTALREAPPGASSPRVADLQVTDPAHAAATAAQLPGVEIGLEC